MFTACYDLSLCPASYDVVAFLLHVEAERIRRRESEVKIVITPGPREGFRADRWWPESIETRKHLLETVVIPMCHMLPSCRSVSCVGAWGEAFGSGRAMYGFKVMLEAMRVAGRPLRPNKPLTKQMNLITITLREADHWPTRNSNIPEWEAYAEKIRSMGFDVVIIRDAPERTHLDYRVALYRSSFCNFFVSNGPAWLAICADAPAIIMKPTTDGLLSCYTRAYFKNCGLVDQLPNNPQHQRIVWQDDNRESIMQAFDQFVADNSVREAVAV